MIKKATKAVEPTSQETVTSNPADVNLPTATPMVSFGLRYLRKKNGSMILQEGVNGVWTDVPMEIE